MSKIANLHNKTFTLQQNTNNGTSNGDTIFHYKQDENLVTATFSGGTILCGNIIALHHGDYLEMIYQMLTVNQELKSGKAIAQISILENSEIQLDLNWEWLSGSGNVGTSRYVS